MTRVAKRNEKPTTKELSGDELEKVQGGANKPSTENLSLNFEEIKSTSASANQRTIIGGFKSLSK